MWKLSLPSQAAAHPHRIFFLADDESCERMREHHLPFNWLEFAHGESLHQAVSTMRWLVETFRDEAVEAVADPRGGSFDETLIARDRVSVNYRFIDRIRPSPKGEIRCAIAMGTPRRSAAATNSGRVRGAITA